MAFPIMRMTFTLIAFDGISYQDWLNFKTPPYFANSIE